MPASLAIRSLLWVWFSAALAVGYYQLLQRFAFSAVPGLLLSLTAMLVLAYRRFAAFRVWVDALDLRAIVLLHVTRFVGLYFLLLSRRGDLPSALAVSGGLGETVVAAFALVVVFAPMTDDRRARAVYVWNVVGSAGILLVVLSAIRIGLTDARQLAALTTLPLCLLPTFLLPLILASHLAIFARLARTADPAT